MHSQSQLPNKTYLNYTFSMKKFIFLVITSLIFQQLAIAQNGERRGERIKAYRVAVFTEQLNLTADEAQVFWPIYNEYTDSKEALQDQYMPAKKLEDMSDAELEAQLLRHFEKEQRELDLEKDMISKLRKVLPLRKIVRIPSAERQFREALFKKLQERKDQRG
jgi:hypothetical protein